MLEIKNLDACIADTPVLKELNLSVRKGEVHAIMGPNGAGKSTLAKVASGHPSYEVTNGQILLDDQDILGMEPEERAQLGLFMSFQYPVEIAGVSNRLFLRTAYNAQQKARNLQELDDAAFEERLLEKMKLLSVPVNFLERNVNEGFSGGEKKKNEILQLAILEPSFAILDETDSGLDIDAIRTVSEGISRLMHPQMGLVLITHYQRLLNFIRPDYVHVMMEGRIISSGGPEFALELEERGYDWLTQASSESGKC